MIGECAVGVWAVGVWAVGECTVWDWARALDAMMRFWRAIRAKLIRAIWAIPCNGQPSASLFLSWFPAWDRGRASGGGTVEFALEQPRHLVAADPDLPLFSGGPDPAEPFVGAIPQDLSKKHKGEKGHLQHHHFQPLHDARHIKLTVAVLQKFHRIRKFSRISAGYTFRTRLLPPSSPPGFCHRPATYRRTLVDGFACGLEAGCDRRAA